MTADVSGLYEFQSKMPVSTAIVKRGLDKVVEDEEKVAN
jgi:hypothetical protein